MKLTVAAPRRCTGVAGVAPLTGYCRPSSRPPVCTVASVGGVVGASGTDSWAGRSSFTFTCCYDSVGASEACHPPRCCRSPAKAASEHHCHSPGPATSQSYSSPATAFATEIASVRAHCTTFHSNCACRSLDATSYCSSLASIASIPSSTVQVALTLHSSLSARCCTMRCYHC